MSYPSMKGTDWISAPRNVDRGFILVGPAPPKVNSPSNQKRPIDKAESERTSLSSRPLLFGKKRSPLLLWLLLLL